MLCARFYGSMHMYYLSTYLSRTCIKCLEGGANEYAWVCVYSVLYSISSEFTSQELCGSDCHQLPNCRAEILDVVLFLDNQLKIIVLTKNQRVFFIHHSISPPPPHVSVTKSQPSYKGLFQFTTLLISSKFKFICLPRNNSIS